MKINVKEGEQWVDRTKEFLDAQAEAEYRKEMVEDIGHLFFELIGVLICAATGPLMAVFGSFAAFAIWRLRRAYIRRERMKDANV